MRETIGDFLLRRLQEAGISEIFGVPGDYNLEFMQQLEDRGAPTWIGCCNELNASYAADGYARLKGLGALVVTHGVGALSAINGVAGAFCEHVPVICVSGALPMRSLAQGLMMHHTLADGLGDEILRAYRQVTVAQTQLTPQNAASEVDRMIRTAWMHKRPVYLELPSDIAYLQIDIPEAPLDLKPAESDEERLRSCVAALAGRLREAARPAFLLDLDAQRFGVLDEVRDLASRLAIPIAAMSTTKGVIPEGSPEYVGLYTGAASPPATKEAVEASDALIAIGHRRIDSTSGFFTDALPPATIRLGAFAAEIAGEHYEAVALKDLLGALADETIEPKAWRREAAPPIEPAPVALSDAPIRQDDYWALMQRFLRPGDVLLAEIGTSSSGAGALALPEGCSFITQAVWGSIGYTLGSLLGTLMAAPQRRHLLFIGDGSFQLTAQELSTILRHGLKPCIFLINNRGYTIERTILGAQARYNDVADWRYHKLAEVFSGRVMASHQVSTSRQLSDVLAGAPDDFLFVETLMAPQDAPAGLIRGGHMSADLDYGPRGPQGRPGAQILARTAGAQRT